MKIKIKRGISLLVILTLVLSLAVGCGTEEGVENNEGNDAENGEFVEPEKLEITICGGSIGGAWAAIGEGVGEVVRRSYSGSNTSYEVGQEAANIALVDSGKIELGIAHTGLMKLAMDGKEPFNKEYSKLRAISVLYGEAAEHFIINNKSGMKSFEDIKANKYPLKVNFNTNDSFMEIVGKNVLESHGITYDDIESWGGKVDFMSMGGSMDLMRDGKIEAYSNVIQVPSSHIIDASSTLDLNLISMSEEAIEKVNADLGTYKVTIPQDSYGFLENDVDTVAATVVLFASEDLSDGDAYAIAKSLHENFDYFKSIHSSLEGLDLEGMVDVSPIPLHPGAERYYEEQGVL